MTSLTTTKKGLTLVELIVALAIVLITMAGFTLLFIRVWTANSFTIEMGIASLAASRGVETAVKHVRNARQAENGAYPIVSANDDEFIFFSDYDGDNQAERVRYYIADDDSDGNGEFSAGIIQPDYSTTPPNYNGTETAIEIADYIVNISASEKTFEYFSDTNPIYEYGDIIGTALTTPATINDVRMVRILLHVNPNPYEAPDHVIIQSFVTIRNLSDIGNATP